MSINKSSIQAVLDTDLEKLLVQTNQVVTGDRFLSPCFVWSSRLQEYLTV